MHRLLIFCPVIIQLIAVACQGCTEPFPHYLKQIDETDGPGTVVLSMDEPPSSSLPTWTIDVTNPVTTDATYLRGFFDIVRNTSDPYQWRIVLVRPLDIERIREDANIILADLTLDVQCSSADTNSVLRYERTIIIRASSEFSPVFKEPLPTFNISEVSSIGTTVASLKNYVTDEDVQNNGEVSDIRRFRTHPYGGNELLNGEGVFGVTPDGDVLLMKQLDYETGMLSYGLNVTVEDTGGLSSWTVIKIDALNANDNPPVFVHKSVKGQLETVAEYRATVELFYSGPITLEPGPIQANDADNDVISYYIRSGYPDEYSTYISLDVSRATVTLTRPVNDSSISHFTLIIEARDTSKDTRNGESITQGHTATASLLLFVSGRDAAFSSPPGTPRSGSSSTIASVNSDALFISVIALSTLSLLLLIAVVVLCCRMKKRKKNRQNDRFIGAAERCNTLKDRKPSDWAVQLRPVERGNSEKVFIRSISRSTPYINEGFVEDKTNDDVFVTGITPYTGVHNENNQRNNNNNHNNNNNNTKPYDHDVISRGIMPYNEEGHVDSMVAARHSATTLPRNAPLSPPAVAFVPVTSANFPAGVRQTAPTNASVNFDSLDLRTSVKPMTEADSRPIRITATHSNNNNNKNVNTSVSNTGTSRSLTSAEVMNELDQIIFNENQYSSDRGEKITHFTNESTTDHNAINDNSHHHHHKTDEAEEGITSFAMDALEFCVMPFDPDSNARGAKTFTLPGDQNLGSPGSPGSSIKDDPVLNSADVYYRQNNGPQNQSKK